VETKETPLLRGVVSMAKVTPTIGAKENEAAFEARIVNAANLLVGNYHVVERNAYTGLQHGWLNHNFELADMRCQPHPEPVPWKRKATATSSWLRFRLCRRPARNGGA
jgi:hypothetical protein